MLQDSIAFHKTMARTFYEAKLKKIEPLAFQVQMKTLNKVNICSFSICTVCDIP